MNKRPVLSVIIPTHNRFELAKLVVKGILDRFNNTEVVISETSEVAQLDTEFSAYIKLGKVKYVRPNQGVDIVTNFETAFQSSTGEYVLFIGDDDFVGPYIENIVEWVKNNDIDALTSTMPTNYYWNDFTSALSGDKYSSSLVTKNFSGIAEKLDTIKNLNLSLDDLGSGLKNMPRAYHGIVSRVLCETIISKYGRMFGGVSPDIFSASLIAKESTKAYIIDYPLTIPGSSGNSGAGMSAKGKHIGSLRSNVFMKAFENLVWNQNIPEFYSVQTIWAFSLNDAYNLMERTTVKKPNFLRLYVKCIIFHFDYKKETVTSFKTYLKNKNVVITGFKILKEVFKETYDILLRIIVKIKNKLNPFQTEFTKYDTIENAFYSLEQKIDITHSIFFNKA